MPTHIIGSYLEDVDEFTTTEEITGFLKTYNLFQERFKLAWNIDAK